MVKDKMKLQLAEEPKESSRHHGHDSSKHE